MIQKADSLPWLFLAFWCCVVVLYLPAYQGGFYEDFIGTLEAYDKRSFYGFLRLTTYSLYFGANFFIYCFITLFHTRPLPWFLLFTGLHALNAVFQIRFFKGLFRLWQVPYSNQLLVAGAFVWLLTPLAAEIINWRACSQYMLSMLLLFMILKWLTDYLEKPGRALWAKIIFTYILSTVFLEYFYLTPVLAFMIITTLAYAKKPTGKPWLKNVLSIVVPMVIVWCCYYILLHQISGRVIPHADLTPAQIPETKSLPARAVGKLNKFIVHTYLMEYFLPINAKKVLYQLLASGPAVLFSAVFLPILAAFSALRLRKAKPREQIITVLLLLFLSNFLLTIPTYFFENFSYQGSRYFYLSNVFGYMLGGCILFRIVSSHKARLAVTALYLCCCIAGTIYLVNNIRHATRIMNKIVYDFHWDKGGDVLLLNLPTLYRGIGIAGAGDPSNFAYHLEVLLHRKVNSRFYDVSSFNMAGPGDGAHVQVIDSMQLKVTLNQEGTWWWFGGFKALDYENELYKVRFTDNGASYLLQFKKVPAPSMVILYQKAGDWKVLDWSKKEEQW